MADVKQLTFTHKEVVEALLQKEGITDGVWGIYIEFGLQGTNIATGPDGTELTPAAVIPIVRIGLQKMPAESSIAVDAARLKKSAPPAKKAKRKGT